MQNGKALIINLIAVLIEKTLQNQYIKNESILS